MRRLLCFVLLTANAISPQVIAASSFDGTWKIDTAESDKLPSAPHVYLLQDGVYQCASCDPPLKILADGRDHRVTGEPCYDAVVVTVLDARTVEETEKKNGKSVGSTRMSVAPDGKTATVTWMTSGNANAEAITGTDVESRLADGPRGSHAISGSWHISKRLSRSENALVVTLMLNDEVFTFADPSGQGYAARLDGTETPFKGDLSHMVVSVKRVGDAIEETDKRNGVVVAITRYTLSADGKTLTVSMENKANATTRQFIARKQ